ncbi:glycosyltransferase family 1 protein [Acidisphaera sp. L21]|uniref:glycosyltransferase family 4 protein n=1 Tax=Acidisphaera sp. L21 TaxID=1641851 RepID=UPI00131B4B8F|nr:glycosyltransferase [Acidisphaera sp. L21]
MKDFVLCVARQESRKNQLMLMRALADTDIPLVLIGHTASQRYRDLIETYRTPNVHTIERLPPNSPMLAAAFAAARVAVLPSWAEGAPLAALEAAASGASLVISDESGESEYFGDYSRYCDPASVRSIRAAVLEAYETSRSPADIAAQKNFIAETYSWTRHRERTIEVYRQVYAARAPEPVKEAPATIAAAADASIAIVYDVTTGANHTGSWTGIARVEAAMAEALRSSSRTISIQLVAWNNKARCFIEIPFEVYQSGQTSALVAYYDEVPPSELILPEGAYYLVIGSGWMQNANYTQGLIAFKHRYRLRLTPLIHDVIPVNFPFWFADNYAPVFVQNLTTLLGNSDQMLVYSQNTRNDVLSFGDRTYNLFIPSPGMFRLGDELSDAGGESAEEPGFAGLLEDKRFILCVGAIHQRKNHKLLYDVWLKLQARMGKRCPTLVLVGGVAWNGHEVANALKGDPRIKDHVLLLSDVDDAGLAWLYRSCLLSVYPSLYEGWGLPVSESLRYGKLCLASNASSVPEIAPDFVELLDPLDPNQWITKIQFYAGSELALKAREANIAENYRSFGWRDSAEQMIDALLLNATQAVPARPYTIGTIISLADRMQAARHRRGGWYLSESWGSWSSHLTAGLEVELTLPMEEEAILIMETQALLFPGGSHDVNVVINGVPVGRWQIRRPGLQIRHAIVPMKVLAGAKRLTIELQNAALTPIARVSKTNDQRSIGIGVGRFALAPIANVADTVSYLGVTHADPQRVWLGAVYDFVNDPKAGAFLEGKWTLSSAWGVFNDKTRPRLALMVPESPNADLSVGFWLRPAATEANPLTLMAIVNTTHCGKWTFTDNQVHRIVVQIPRQVRAAAEPLQIDLVPGNQHSPNQLKIGSADQKFGFSLIRMVVSTAATPAAPIPDYTLGTPLLLTAEGVEANPAAEAVLSGPWYKAEQHGAWSFGALAQMRLRLWDRSTSHRINGDLILSAELGVFDRGGELPLMQITANGVGIGTAELGKSELGQIRVLIPRSVIQEDGVLALDFGIEKALSPFLAGRSKDERLLGLRFRSLSIRQAVRIPEAQIIAFQRGAQLNCDFDPRSIATGRWHPPERSGRWSIGDEGKIVFVPAAHLAGNVRMFAVAHVIGASEERPVAIDVEVNGRVIDQWVFRADRAELIELQQFAEALIGDAEAELSLRHLDPKSPRELGLHDDPRVLGVMVRGLVVTDSQVTLSQAGDMFRAAGIRFDSLLKRDTILAEMRNDAAGFEDEETGANAATAVPAPTAVENLSLADPPVATIVVQDAGTAISPLEDVAVEDVHSTVVSLADDPTAIVYAPAEPSEAAAAQAAASADLVAEEPIADDALQTDEALGGGIDEAITAADNRRGQEDAVRQSSNALESQT